MKTLVLENNKANGDFVSELYDIISTETNCGYGWNPEVNEGRDFSLVIYKEDKPSLAFALVGKYKDE